MTSPPLNQLNNFNYYLTSNATEVRIIPSQELSYNYTFYIMALLNTACNFKNLNLGCNRYLNNI